MLCLSQLKRCVRGAWCRGHQLGDNMQIAYITCLSNQLETSVVLVLHNILTIKCFSTYLKIFKQQNILHDDFIVCK